MFANRRCVVAAAGSVLALTAAGCQYTVWSSVGWFGDPGNGLSGSASPSLSADGRYVAFHSDSSNLVPSDGNGVDDVFVRDHQTGATSRVSLPTEGLEANSNSHSASISADGRYVAFTSTANTLVIPDTNNAADVFVRDRQTGRTVLASAFSGSSEWEGNGASGTGGSKISADGRYVAFSSVSSDLVAGDTNGKSDVFVRDLYTLNTTRVSVSNAGIQGNGASGGIWPHGGLAISNDGSVVAFSTAADNLVAGDTNGRADVVVRAGGTTSLVSRSSGGAQGNGDSEVPDLNADGSIVVFDSDATNLVGGDTNGHTDVFVHHRGSGGTSRAIADQQGDLGASSGSISDDGRFVAFGSASTNLVAGDTNGASDGFVLDRTYKRVARVSTTALGGQHTGGAGGMSAVVSGDGRYVAVDGWGRLDPADTNGRGDIYLKFAGEPTPTKIDPVKGEVGKSVNVTIDGSGFEAGDQVGLSGGGVNVTNVQVVDDSTITATFEILPGASTGARWVAVSRAAGGWNSALGAVGTCVGCFTVSS